MELQGLAEGRRARNADDVHDLLVSVGDLTERRSRRGRSTTRPRGSSRCSPKDARSACAWPARQRAGRGRGCRGAAGRARRLAPDRPAGRVHRSRPSGRSRRWSPDTRARTRRSSPARRRRGWAPERTACGRRWTRWRRPGASPTASSARGGGVEREWCDVDVLRRLRRRSLAALRKEVEPVDAATLGRFLPEWQGVATPATGPDALMDAIARLQGAAVPASILEHDVLRSRVSAASVPPTWTRCARAATWSGSAPARSGPTTAASSLYVRTRCGCSRRRRRRTRRRASSTSRSASTSRPTARRSGPTWSRRPGPATSASCSRALWDLVWAGEVTNDTLAPLRALTAKTVPRDAARGLQAAARRAPHGRDRPRAPDAGRSSPRCWSRRPARPRWRTRERCSCSTATACSRARRCCPRACPGGFAGVYGVLKALEMSGKVRRGYFVDGLGAAQFAVPGAVDRIRALREPARGERARRRCSWRRRILPSRTARRSRGPRGRVARPVRRGRSWCWWTASSRRSWSVARAAC